MGETCPKRVVGSALVQWALRDAIRTCSNYKCATQGVLENKITSLGMECGAVVQQLGAVDVECHETCNRMRVKQIVHHSRTHRSQTFWAKLQSDREIGR